jgi:predicted phosphatase
MDEKIMQSSNDYTPEARKRNNLRKIVDRIRVWEDKKIKRPKMTIYADDYGNIKNIREEREV